MGRPGVCIAAVAMMGWLGGVAAASGPSAPAVKTLLLRPGEMPGYVPRGKPIIAASALDLVNLGLSSKTARAAIVTRLRSEGFRDGVSQHEVGMGANSAAQGVSVAMVFKTPAGAAQEFPHYWSIVMTGPTTMTRIARFTVSGVPGARAFEETAKGTQDVAANVLFTTGRCLILIGNAANKSDVGALTTGARRLFARIEASCS